MIVGCISSESRTLPGSQLKETPVAYKLQGFFITFFFKNITILVDFFVEYYCANLFQCLFLLQLRKVSLENL